jgi:hypothetical protein
VTDDAVRALAALLDPYADPDPQQVGRLIDVPPAVAEQVLQLLLPDQRTTRPNMTQPPMGWLVEQARDLDGRLVGSLAAGRAYARFDGIQVAAAVAGELAARVAAAWPGTADSADALAAAVAEGWHSWTATDPTWTGSGTDLLTDPLPPDTAIIGLWWG